MRFVRKLALVGLVVLVAAQLVPVSKTNPPVESDVTAPAEVKAILKRACYDCHSHETVWPWYASVAPVSWLVARDVNEGREHLNFSRWGNLSSGKQAEAFKHIREEVSEGGMPLPFYLPLHSEARLTDADKAAIEAWTRAGQ